VRIWGDVLNAAQVQSNFLFGPWKFPGAPKSISLAAVSNLTVNCGVTLEITNSATDPNLPPLPLTFSLPEAPTNALIDPVSGLITWRPLIAQAGSTNVFSVAAADSGQPGLSTTRSFSATVLPVSSPQLGAAALNNGLLGLTVNGMAGPDYCLQASADLISWTNLFFTNPVALPFDWTDTNVNQFNQRFYRVLLGP